MAYLIQIREWPDAPWRTVRILVSHAEAIAALLAIGRTVPGVRLVHDGTVLASILTPAEDLELGERLA
jgi:hypothetical protein